MMPTLCRGMIGKEHSTILTWLSNGTCLAAHRSGPTSCPNILSPMKISSTGRIEAIALANELGFIDAVGSSIAHSAEWLNRIPGRPLTSECFVQLPPSQYPVLLLEFETAIHCPPSRQV
uniref:Uncharacterized protein n=1 Tax=Haptolina brevifila TaxID=156173 RepID=A0A7S2DBE3_9EUKA